MPQAADNYGFNDDSEAIDLLKKTKRFIFDRGVIYARVGITPTKRETEAISYLFGEWDYGYAGPWPNLSESAE